MPWPPRFLFLSGSLALDFVHTGGTGWRAQWERWHLPEDLADWAAASPLAVRPRVSEGDLADGRDLREAIWEGAHAVLRREALPVDAVRVIEARAACPSLVPVLREGARAWSEESVGSQLLSTVARDAMKLLGTGARARLRECRNPECFLLFLDTSRAGTRAWCTMRRCGNLSKIRRYRRGRRGAASREEET